MTKGLGLTVFTVSNVVILMMVILLSPSFMSMDPRSGKVQGLRASEFIELLVDRRLLGSSCYLPVVVLCGSSG